jgi:hypothetical protein
MTQSICASGQLLVVALGDDDINSVKGLSHVNDPLSGPTSLIPARIEVVQVVAAEGIRQHLAHRLTPRAVISSQSGPPFSHNSCRHLPQGISGWPLPLTQDTATSRPPPVRCSCETSPHSAHSATP